jgi:hypothetical protein
MLFGVQKNATSISKAELVRMVMHCSSQITPISYLYQAYGYRYIETQQTHSTSCQKCCIKSRANSLDILDIAICSEMLFTAGYLSFASEL